ncbi:hypothetical protein [Streptosporangium sp. NPDC049046]|uniref:hypothetical protein n=1 Tax=Streptosporangium sp. NPDC049046 TaxID=3155031 RepID=UPI0034319EFD
MVRTWFSADVVNRNVREAMLDVLRHLESGKVSIAVLGLFPRFESGLSMVVPGTRSIIA